jgi:hypothetical protein
VQYRAGSRPYGVRLADVNGDGDLDAAVAKDQGFGSDPGSLSVFLGNGDGTFQPRLDIPLPAGAIAPAVADLHTDGRPDVAVADFASGDTSVLLNRTPIPSVATGTAQPLTHTSAHVSGQVNPNGSTTSWFVEYGQTLSYGKTTSPENLAAANLPISVHANVKHLRPGATVHYRLAASNAVGTTYGADRTYTTP